MKNIFICLHEIFWKLISLIEQLLRSLHILPKMESMDDDSDFEIIDDDDGQIAEVMDYQEQQQHVPLEQQRRRKYYEFRPFEIVKINYVADKISHYPSPRSGHRSVCTESNLYCLGGFNPSVRLTMTARRQNATCLFQELWQYNFVSRRWKLCLNQESKNMPEELASNAVIVHNNILIAYGGTGYPFGEACSNQSYIFSTRKAIVKQLDVNGDLPTAMYGPVITVHQNYLYTIGGTTGFDYSCDVYRLDLASKQWEMIYICRPEMRDDPHGRYRHEVIYNGKHIYVLGGGTSQTAFDLKTIPAFNLELNKWDFFETNPDKSVKSSGGYPEPRKCYSCIQYKTTLANSNTNSYYNSDDDSDNYNNIEAVIAGGYGEIDKCYSDIWKINLKTLQWKLLRTAQLPNPIYFHSAATPGNGCMYLFGGIEVNDDILTRTNDLYKMWATIPKLSEICWDAITYYNPSLDSYTKKKLLSYGIPQRFVDRVHN